MGNTSLASSIPVCDERAVSVEKGRLAPGGSAGYCVSMDDTVWMILIGIGGVVLWLLIHQRYRRWKAGKLADKLLSEVVKGKDAFRR